MHTPMFSFIMPCYKRQFLGKAIESILAQTYDDFELVVVNDASPENRHAGADGHGGSHRIQQHEQHRRPPAPPAGPRLCGGSHRRRHPHRAVFSGLSLRPGTEAGHLPFDFRLLQRGF